MITLTITGETMQDVMDKLTGYGFTVPQSSPIPAPTPAAPVASPPVIVQEIPHGAPFTYTPVAVASPTQQPAAPIVPMTPPPASPVPTTQAPAYTLDQVTRAGADLITARADLMPQLMALMPKYGVQTLAALNPDQLGAVAIELRAMGANI